MEKVRKLVAVCKERGARAALHAVMNRLDRELRLCADRWGFDRRYHVDTSGLIAQAGLDISKAQRREAVHYEPMPVKALRGMLKTLAIDHDGYTFIDFGSGKGRTLLLASEYPFKKIIGVEFSRPLHGAATNNITAWKSPAQRCFDIESLCMDARSFMLPDSPLVIFLFNPFSPLITSELVAHIKESLHARPRPLHLLYYGDNACFINQLNKLDLPVFEICTRRPFAAMDTYRGLLFSTEGDAVFGNAQYSRFEQKPFLCDDTQCELNMGRGSQTQEVIGSRK